MLDAVLEWLTRNYAAQAVVVAWGMIFLQYAILALIERFAPAERGQSVLSVLANLRITFAFLLLTPIANFLPGLLANQAVQFMGGGWVQLDLPAAFDRQNETVRWTLELMLVFVPLLVFDFFYYWFHRLQHTSKWLWLVHRLHHTDQSVNVTTSLRHHWLEEPLRSLFILIPMNLLFQITPVQSGVLGVFLGAWGYVIHMNLRLNLGPLLTVFVGPQGHRIHHSVLAQHQNRNFAAFFPVWDILFGTFHRAKPDEYPPTGVADAVSNPALGAVLVGPFFGWRDA
jgi:sterol desaturase/sphingolipid hydroxylase (fatty acid hydroxylase superfamily)